MRVFMPSLMAVALLCSACDSSALKDSGPAKTSPATLSTIGASNAMHSNPDQISFSAELGEENPNAPSRSATEGVQHVPVLSLYGAAGFISESGEGSFSMQASFEDLDPEITDQIDLTPSISYAPSSNSIAFEANGETYTHTLSSEHQNLTSQAISELQEARALRKSVFRSATVHDQ